MRDLLIIGARGYGREVYSLALSSAGWGTRFVVKGFLDDKTDALDSFEGYPPILSSVESYEVQANDIFVCALGDVRYKTKYAQMILNKGGEFTTLIHSTAFIDPMSTIGKGCLIGAFTYVACGVVIDDFATIQHHVTFGHDVHVSKWCQINSQSFMGGWVEVAERATIHTGAKVLPNLSVGQGAIVGAGAVVTKPIDNETTVIGVPARTLGFHSL